MMGFRGLNYGGFQGLLPENEEELLFPDASDDSPPSWDTQMMGRRTSEAIYPSSTPSSAAGLIHSPALAEAFLTNALEDFLEQHNINLLSVNSAKSSCTVSLSEYATIELTLTSDYEAMAVTNSWGESLYIDITIDQLKELLEDFQLEDQDSSMEGDSCEDSEEEA